MKKISLVIFYSINLVVILWFWSQNSFSLLSGDAISVSLSLGRLTALLLVFCVLMQFMLIGRIKWIESIFGLDKLSRIHKWNGYSLFVFLILHPLLIVYSYGVANGFSWFRQLWFMVTKMDDIVGAVVAVALLLLVIVLSITIARKRLKYETWYVVHLSTYIAVLLAWGHQLELGEDFHGNMAFTGYWYALYAFVAINFLWYRLFKPLYNFYRCKFTVSKVIPETYDTNSIYISGESLQPLGAKPGQFIIVRFLAWPYLLEAHPFSLSMVPTDSELRITPKGVGDYTKKLSALKPGTKVFIDGPHGVFTVDKKTHGKTLLIAGGVGITPLRSLAEQLSKQENNMVLLYGNKSSKDIIFGEELSRINGLTIHHVMSNPEPEWQGLTGYINKEKIQRLVPDVQERDVFLCGPPVMMNLVNRSLLELGLKPSQIHFEEFSL